MTSVIEPTNHYVWSVEIDIVCNVCGQNINASTFTHYTHDSESSAPVHCPYCNTDFVIHVKVTFDE